MSFTFWWSVRWVHQYQYNKYLWNRNIRLFNWKIVYVSTQYQKYFAEKWLSIVKNPYTELLYFWKITRETVSYLSQFLYALKTILPHFGCFIGVSNFPIRDLCPRVSRKFYLNKLNSNTDITPRFRPSKKKLPILLPMYEYLHSYYLSSSLSNVQYHSCRSNSIIQYFD